MPSDLARLAALGRPLSANDIQKAISAVGLDPLPISLAERFAAYAGLLQRWNAKLNLTALRSPDQILERHFLECIFCAQHLAGAPGNLLDFGSGAGFPGIPIALCRPEIRVKLAESNGRKAAFLREAVRVLDLSVEVYGGRVEDMALNDVYAAVTMRAVDRMTEALPVAVHRLKVGGRLILLTTTGADLVGAEGNVRLESSLPIPNTAARVLLQFVRG